MRNNAGIRELEDLAGRAIALPVATTPDRLIRSIIDQKKLNIRIVPVRDNAEGFLALSTGRAEAFATDNILLYSLRHTSRSPGDFAVVGRALDYSPYGLMTQKNNTVFLSIVNAVLARSFRSGEADALFEKWFGPLEFPKPDLLASAFRLQSIPD